MKEILNADSTWSILNDSNYWKTGKNPNSGRSLQTEVRCFPAHGALGNLVWWEVSLSTAGTWNQMMFKLPFNSSHFRILWF